jgi:hypothetical protein
MVGSGVCSGPLWVLRQIVSQHDVEDDIAILVLHVKPAGGSSVPTWVVTYEEARMEE